jgi:hypothetical protein
MPPRAVQGLRMARRWARKGASGGWGAVPTDEPDAWADNGAPAGVDPAVTAWEARAHTNACRRPKSR